MNGRLATTSRYKIYLCLKRGWNTKHRYSLYKPPNYIMSTSAFHDNLQEVSTTIVDLENNLRLIQQAANTVDTAIPAEFRVCYDVCMPIS